MIPEDERGDMVGAYYRRLTGNDKETKDEAARAWSIWEGSTSKLFFDYQSIERLQTQSSPKPLPASSVITS